MSSDTFEPIGDVLTGVQIREIPEKWAVVEAFVVLKCLDENGSPAWLMRATRGLADEELLGALLVHAEVVKAEIVSQYVDDEEDE